MANNTVELATCLKRAKVLLVDLDDVDIIDWINHELSGYSDADELPQYRMVKGSLKGSYYKGSLASHTQWNNVSIPLGKMPKDFQDSLLTISFTDGVSALSTMYNSCHESNHSVSKPISADLFPYIANWNDDLYMIFTSLRVEVGSQILQNIISTVESKLLDILIELEKTFGNLDDLDIDIESKNADEIKMLKDNITIIINNNDNHIEIGNDNTIRNSDIGSENHESSRNI